MPTQEKAAELTLCWLPSNIVVKQPGAWNHGNIGCRTCGRTLNIAHKSVTIFLKKNFARLSPFLTSRISVSYIPTIDKCYSRYSKRKTSDTSYFCPKFIRPSSKQNGWLRKHLRSFYQSRCAYNCCKVKVFACQCSTYFTPSWKY